MISEDLHAGDMNWGKGRPRFWYGRQSNCICPCTVSPFGILKVLEAMVKCVYPVIQYTNCSHIYVI
jgi:hypothetical protein